MSDQKQTPNPRQLDPKFKDAEVPADADKDPVNQDDSRSNLNNRTDTNRTTADENQKEESPDEVRARLASGEVANDPDEGQIVYRHSVVDSAGNTVQKEHGPMPRGEWARYSAENGL